ncbi:velvet factor [Naematelia encephala]|uniref:Velvet factor n=1 Tax=Naematelia encephala TaxID=71784 RepID=A0A1Y2AQF9_9TREE|nr:velvet factor [Naematelia encephala]
MNLGEINFSDHGRTYRITPIQHPIRSSAFHNAYLSRIPLAPPLIIQLDCWGSDGQLTIPHDELPFLVCHLTLQTPSGDDATLVRSPQDEVVAMLYGTLVAAPAEMNDLTGAAGVYFAFPDVSVRYVGRFRLRASLMRITGGPPLDTCITETIGIVENSDYVAPPVTDLTRHFDSQGIIRFGLPRAEW